MIEEILSREIMGRSVFIYIVMGFAMIGLVVKLIVSRIFRKLIKDSDNMGGANSKLLKQIKLKFESYYKLNLGVSNVDIFVDKYVYRHKVGGFLLSTWEGFGVQIIAWCLLTGIVGSLLGIIYGMDNHQNVVIFSLGIIAGSALIIIEMYSNIKLKHKILCTNLKDYLDNYLRVRLEHEYFYKENLDKYRREYFSDGKESEVAATDSQTATEIIADNITNTILNSLEKKDVLNGENTGEGIGNTSYDSKLCDNEDMEYLLKTLNSETYEKKIKEHGNKKSKKVNKKSNDDEMIIEEILKEYLA